MNFSTSLLVTNISNAHDFPLYNALCHYFLSWYLPLVICVGIGGTGFCASFLCQSASVFPRSMVLWLTSICIGDLLILLLEAVWLMGKTSFNWDLRDSLDVVCATHTFFSNYFFYWSSYMQCAMSLQRAYLVLRPLQAHCRKISWNSLLATWLTISICLLVVPMPYMLFWRVRNGDCDPPSSNSKTYYRSVYNSIESLDFKNIDRSSFVIKYH